MDKAFFSDTPHIQYGETDMEPLVRNACRFGCDIQIVCTRGTAEISTGIQSYGMRRGTELFLFGGTLVQVSDPSPDFTVRMLLYPKDVVIKAILPIDSDFLNYLHEYPFLDHIGGGAPEDEWENVLQWMDMARLLFTRPVQYFRFMRLIRENSAREHQVPFYADKLCISPRYLGDIVVENFGGMTPKQLIDKQLIAEIKVQLDNPLFSVSEIAQYLNFPEHTSMSRFFKRNTGMSPKEYRASRR